VQIVAELMQRKDVPSDPSDPKSPKIRRYGGSTIHLNADGAVRYIIHKGLDESGRDARQQAHFERNLAARGSSTYIKDRDALDTTVNFAAAHRGY